jgi:lipopolysaccharide export LptBFGC system permease protein LptF
MGPALMGILARHVASRFLWNFAALFGALYLFGVGIDVVISTNKFLEAADLAVRQGLVQSRLMGFVVMLLDFHGPRIFQFLQFMVGMVSVGAMGFTFSQMHRARELTAIMAAGIDLRRIALVVLLAALGLNLVQLASQEWILPRLAPKLVRTHADMVEGRGSSFPVPLSRDASGKLLQASAFDPTTGRLAGLIVLERDERGRARTRISADAARWDAAREVWVLEGGKAIRLPDSPQARATTEAGEFERPADEVATNLGPESILTRRFRIYGQMLSTPQLLELRDGGGPDRTLAGRLLASRILGPLVNLLVLASAIPYFLLREPRGMLGQSLRAAAFAVPVSITALTLTTVPLSGLPPLLGAAIPAALLLPWAAWRLSALRS